MCGKSIRGAAAALLVVISGCGGDGPVPVEGVLKVDGKPLAQAMVQFVSQQEGGRNASGTTDASGVFHLTTLRPRDGALPGSYKVIVHYQEPGELPKDLANPGDVQKAVAQGRAKPRKASFSLPPSYTDPARTVLKQDVPCSGPVVLELVSTKS